MRTIACVCVVAVGLSSVNRQSESSRLVITDALNAYDRGQFAQVFDAISLNGAVDANLYSRFAQDAERWIATGPTEASERRILVAASVAVEIAHRLRSQPPVRAAQYLVWASLLMRRRAPAVPTEIERLWYLASMAGMEELSEPWALTIGHVSGDSDLERERRRLGEGGHLRFALQRFPTEPRFLLARVEASELREPGRALVPSYIAFLRGRARAQTSVDLHSSAEWAAAGLKLQATQALSTISRIPDFVVEYRALQVHVSLRAEVELRVGCLESIQGNVSQALDSLGRVPTLTNEVFLKYLSAYLMGRTYQNLGNSHAAIASFEQAANLVPNARAAATQLAAELFLSDRFVDRERAFLLLQASYGDSAVDDPWRSYEHGDARLWPLYMAQLRQAF